MSEQHVDVRRSRFKNSDRGGIVRFKGNKPLVGQDLGGEHPKQCLVFHDDNAQRRRTMCMGQCFGLKRVNREAEPSYYVRIQT